MGFENDVCGRKWGCFCAINTTILEASDITDKYKSEFKLALSYKDKDGNEIDLAKLPEDLTVTFADSKGAFNADGTLKDVTKLPAKGNKITVVATVKSESQGVNLTTEYQVTVVDADDYKEVTDAQLKLSSGVVVNTAVVGDSIELVPTKAVKNDGTVLDATKETSPDTVGWGANSTDQVKSVESSNVTVLTAAYDATNDKVVLTPISEGTAKVTVTLQSGAKFEKTVTVKEAARKATTATAEAVTLSTTDSSKTVKVTVKDQYGDPFKASGFLYAHPGKTGTDAVVTITTTPVSTDAKGETTITLAAAPNAVTGTDTVKLSTSSDATKDGIGTIPVSFFKAEDTVTSYAIRVASDSPESNDAKLDVYNPSDDTVKLEFIGKDKNGVVAKIFNQGELSTDGSTTYKVESSNADVATVAIDAQKDILVTGKKAGTATITVKEGNIVRATFDVTVVDSTPSIGTLSVKSGAKIYVNSGQTDTSDNVKLVGAETAYPTFYSQQSISDLIEVKSGDKTFTLAYNGTNKNFDVKDGSNVIGTVKVFTSDPVNLPLNADGQTLEPADVLAENSTASVIFKLYQGSNVVGTVAVPVVFDQTAPNAPTVSGVGSAFADNKLNATEVGTAQTFKVDLTGTGATAGDLITLSIASGTPYTLTSNDITNGYANVTVSGTTLASLSGAVNVTATVKDKANNTSPASTAYSIVVDKIAPTVSSVTFANGSGATSGSFDAGDTITIVFSEAVAASSLGVTGLTAGGSVTGVSLATFFNTSGGIGGFASGSLSGVVGTVALSADGTTVTVTVNSGVGTGTTAPSGVFTAATTVTDVAGNAVTSGTTGTTSGSF
ncbi:hypothetical protein [Anoxybacillus sp. MB8]|uniref:beta strand repeat-containing protein n=1 Tax=Anoxybacillus sp. MB8 TaxID=2496850 RepID=UPI0013CF4654|nr:hypothetical protein [Anoxybacillus sp. MB8]